MLTKREIPVEKLNSLQIEMNGQEICAKGTITINGVEMRDGIKSVELNLDANQRPVITIEYDKRVIKQELAKALGLEKEE